MRLLNTIEFNTKGQRKGVQFFLPLNELKTRSHLCWYPEYDLNEYAVEKVNELCDPWEGVLFVDVMPNLFKNKASHNNCISIGFHKNTPDEKIKELVEIIRAELIKPEYLVMIKDKENNDDI